MYKDSKLTQLIASDENAVAITDKYLIQDANNKLSSTDLGCMADYVFKENIKYSLSENQARIALKLGVKLDIISKFEHYHGSHKDEHSKMELNIKNFDGFYSSINDGPFTGGYQSYLNKAYISPDYNISKVDISKLHQYIIDIENEQTNEDEDDLER